MATELFTVEEVSRILKVNKNAVYSLVNAGELRAMRLGRVKIPSFEIERFLSENIGMDITDPFNKKTADWSKTDEEDEKVEKKQ